MKKFNPIKSSGKKQTILKDSKVNLNSNRNDLKYKDIPIDCLDFFKSNKGDNHIIITPVTVYDGNKSKRIIRRTTLKNMKIINGKNKGKSIRILFENNIIREIIKNKSISYKEKNRGLTLEKDFEKKIKKNDSELNIFLIQIIGINSPIKNIQKDNNSKGPTDFIINYYNGRQIHISIKSIKAQRANILINSIINNNIQNILRYRETQIRNEMMIELSNKNNNYINIENNYEIVKNYSKEFFDNKPIGFNNHQTKNMKKLQNFIIYIIEIIKNKCLKNPEIFKTFLYENILNLSGKSIYELIYDLDKLNKEILIPNKIIKIPTKNQLKFEKINCFEFNYSLMTGSGTGFNIQIKFTYIKNGIKEYKTIYTKLRYCNRITNDLRFQTTIDDIKEIEKDYQTVYVNNPIDI